ncbi:4-aminobutyrate--2-oxoglutarate transaminase [Scrofimicrobium sp. R131]|uniref:(S)-3-amino-2-methylpropionate transaminase n=1 Tax=Scrofimicrobium appendicitidis TaxID=3079930 RepID=A0AAU7V5U4_9ACTO
MATIPQDRQLKTALPGPASSALSARAQAAIPRANSATIPAYAAAADRGIIEDVDGNRLIDFASGIAVTSVGASAPAVVAAIQAQAQQFTHTSAMITPYEGYIAVAEKLNSLTPGDFPKKTSLFNSGAEAVENAIKVARTYTGRQAVVAFDHAFHGRTSLTMALTAKAVPYKLGFGPFSPEVYRMPASYPYRDGLSGAEAAARSIQAMEKQIGASQIAAVIIEPVQGEGGFIVPAPGFLPALQQWCNDNGVVFIADEIQSGIARTGTWFACEDEGVVPDLVTIAKGVAGGMPLSAVTGRAEMMDAPGPGALGGTYGGNPIACAAALATLEMIEQEHLLERARQIETLVVDQLSGMQAQDNRIGQIRGRGAMIALELVQPGTTEPNPELTAQVASRCREQGLILLTCGTYGNVIRLLPALTISDQLLTEGISIIEAALNETKETN